MGFRFRKSVNFGPLRVNLSKSGVGYSVGGKGFRVTKKAGGGVRTTASIPGTGVSYVKDYSTSGKKKTSSSGGAPQPPSTPGEKKHRKWPYVVAALLIFGAIGSCMPNDDDEPSPGGAGSASMSSDVSTSTPEPPAITSITLDCDQAIEMDIKETKTVSVSVLEEGADTANLEFTSSAPDILTFAPQEDNALSGVITPLAEGSAEISVSFGDVHSQVITVTVIDSERIAAEEAAAQQAAEEAAAQEPQEQMVWIPESGSKYHRDPDCSGMENPTQVPISTAEARGYTPCKRCF